MDTWNPAQYDRFKSERSQPFWDLSRLISFAGAASMLDIGCGTGSLTCDLHVREKIPRTLGIDSSGQMLAQAPRSIGLEFQKARVEEFKPDEPFDIVISNAALQWVEGHSDLFRKILGWIKPGGQIAIQMPTNFDHPSHTIANEVALRLGLKPRFPPVLPMEDYARLFFDCGARDINIFTKLYVHPMRSADQVVEWVKGTYLTHFEKQLEPARYHDFVRAYSKELIEHIGSGPYLYTFKRLFLYARI